MTIENSTSATVATATMEASPADVIRVGVIGYGYWGPNIVRNLASLEHCEVAAICDKRPSALKVAGRACPTAQLTSEFADILRSPTIDAVAVITPVWTHYELAHAALENGKHVRSEEHTSELQSHVNLVCRLLLEKKKKKN